VVVGIFIEPPGIRCDDGVSGSSHEKVQGKNVGLAPIEAAMGEDGATQLEGQQTWPQETIDAWRRGTNITSDNVKYKRWKVRAEPNRDRAHLIESWSPWRKLLATQYANGYL
jgi:hypothetical protein